MKKIERQDTMIDELNSLLNGGVACKKRKHFSCNCSQKYHNMRM